MGHRVASVDVWQVMTLEMMQTSIIRGRFARLSAAGAVMLFVTSGCFPEQIQVGETLGSVTTLVDSGPALRSARTFALPDTVVEVGTGGGGAIQHANDDAVVAQVREHLTQLGWVDLTESGSVPDVIVLIAASTRLEVGYTYDNWWGAWGYLPYWGPTADPGWLWGAPVGTIEYAYRAGTILITMLDLRTDRAATARVPLLWAAALDGILTGSTTLDRALAGVDQSFTQSPYLARDP